MERMCSICREVKDGSEFYYRKKTHEYNSYCRDCQRTYNAQYMRAYREIHIERTEKKGKDGN